MNELWRPIPGYESRYEVSDRGRVRVIGIDAIGRKRCSGRVLSPAIQRKYFAVVLHLNCTQKNFHVHRLVMLAFCGPCPTGKNVNHKNGDKLDNRVENLEYLSQRENYRHALDTLGFKPPHGEKHWSSTLNEESVREIRARAAAGEWQSSIAGDFGIAQSCISKIVTRRAWKHVL